MYCMCCYNAELPDTCEAEVVWSMADQNSSSAFSEDLSLESTVSPLFVISDVYVSNLLQLCFCDTIRLGKLLLLLTVYLHCMAASVVLIFWMYVFLVIKIA